VFAIIGHLIRLHHAQPSLARTTLPPIAGSGAFAIVADRRFDGTRHFGVIFWCESDEIRCVELRRRWRLSGSLTGSRAG
jgi:hypothetical protein